MQVEAVVHSSKKMSIFQFLGTLVLGKLGKTDLEVDLSNKEVRLERFGLFLGRSASISLRFNKRQVHKLLHNMFVILIDSWIL